MSRSPLRQPAAPAQSLIDISCSYKEDLSTPTTLLRRDRVTGALLPVRHTAPFLKGPIPMAWLQSAAGLPGKALSVAVAIRYLAGMIGMSGIRLNRRVLRDMRISRDACSDGVRRLEAAGLIRVTRSPGARPHIDIVEG